MKKKFRVGIFMEKIRVGRATRNTVFFFLPNQNDQNGVFLEHPVEV